MSIRCVVCGCRDFDNVEFVDATLFRLLAPVLSDVEIVEGDCRGVDKNAEVFARRHSVPCSVFPADWPNLGRAAGPIRNQQMLDYAVESAYPVVIAFWDNVSRGTADMIRRSVEASAHVCVVDITNSSVRWIS